MPTELTEIEARILGSLVEKSLATPEQYPLSVNSLTAACNQKTSREPVMELAAETVGKSLYPLMTRGLVEQLFDVGNRVPKFRHRIKNLLQDENPKIVGLVCVLLLRGPQTPGEIKGRTERLCEFASTAEVEALLRELAARPDPIVAVLPRRPGQKETRFRHLFCGGPAIVSPEPAAVRSSSEAPTPAPRGEDRVAVLERRVRSLESAVRRLEEKLAASPPGGAAVG